MTPRRVADGQKHFPTHEEKAIFGDRAYELYGRFRQGSIDASTANNNLQLMVEGERLEVASNDHHLLRLPISTDLLKAVAGWLDFFREVFDIKESPILRVPGEIVGAGQLIINFPSMTLWRIWQKCVRTFPCMTETFIEGDIKLELQTVKSKRVWKLRGLQMPRRDEYGSAYGAWLLNSLSPEELAGLEKTVRFANFYVDGNLGEAVIGGITLEERLLFELKYRWENNGQRPPFNSVPKVCFGSRYIHSGAVKGVPLVGSVQFQKSEHFFLGIAHDEDVSEIQVLS